jgi:nitrogen regulatory protein P-II 1
MDPSREPAAKQSASVDRVFELIAIVPTYVVDEVRKAFVDAGIVGMTMTDVFGYGRQRGHTEHYKGSEYTVDFIPKKQLMILVPETQLDHALETLTRTVRHHTNKKIGAGVVYVKEVARAIRIRTGEQLFAPASTKP